jgi:hypothetical protein
MHDRNQFD